MRYRVYVDNRHKDTKNDRQEALTLAKTLVSSKKRVVVEATRGNVIAVWNGLLKEV
jgi:hypothetical protein